MCDQPLVPAHYSIENTWWKGQYVSVGDNNTIVGHKANVGGTRTVRLDHVLYLLAANHKDVVAARVQG